MSLPPLENWERSIRDLHKAGRLLGALGTLLREHVSGYFELALKPIPEGLTTDVMPLGSSVTLDMRASALTVKTPAETVMIPLSGSSQLSLLAAVIDALRPYELSTDAGMSVDAFFSALGGHLGAPADPRAGLADAAMLEIDPQTARDYADIQYRVFTGIARFRARLSGPQLPLVVWPEHFDLSGLWFNSSGGMDDHKDAHINIGFAPYSPGFERPYLYAYGYPLKDGYTAPQFPAPAYWYSDKWTGAVVPYDQMPDDVEAFVESTSGSIYAALNPLLRT
ncbi:MAG: hypothetical protein KF726_16995 [Anaerolineae bacterium]|nr:hypothetical protein [Anaerolineae bacterium]